MWNHTKHKPTRLLIFAKGYLVVADLQILVVQPFLHDVDVLHRCRRPSVLVRMHAQCRLPKEEVHLPSWIGGLSTDELVDIESREGQALPFVPTDSLIQHISNELLSCLPNRLLNLIRLHVIILRLRRVIHLRHGFLCGPIRGRLRGDILRLGFVRRLSGQIDWTLLHTNT